MFLVLVVIEEVRMLMLCDTCLKEEELVEVQHSLAKEFITRGLSAYGEMVLPMFSNFSMHRLFTSMEDMGLTDELLMHYF